MSKGFTLKKLIRVQKELDKVAIKPYRGFVGLDEKGFFEIKSEEEFKCRKQWNQP